MDIVGGYLPCPSIATWGARVGVLQDHLRAPRPDQRARGSGWFAGSQRLWRAGRRSARVAVLGGGLAYGALHFGLQGKGWSPPLPVCLFRGGRRRRRAGRGPRGRGWRPGVLVVALAVTAGGLGQGQVAPEWIAAKQARVRAVVEALAVWRETQVFDTTDGGVHALYLLGARQPTLPLRLPLLQTSATPT